MKDFDSHVKSVGDMLDKWVPLAVGTGLALFFGVGWIFIPLLVLTFFFPRLGRVVYATILFMVLGTFFTLAGFLISVANDWLPWSMASWWKVAHWLYIPTAICSLYLSQDINTYRKS